MGKSFEVTCLNPVAQRRVCLRSYPEFHAGPEQLGSPQPLSSPQPAPPPHPTSFNQLWAVGLAHLPQLSPDEGVGCSGQVSRVCYPSSVHMGKPAHLSNGGRAVWKHWKASTHRAPRAWCCPYTPCSEKPWRFPRHAKGVGQGFAPILTSSWF